MSEFQVQMSEYTAAVEAFLEEQFKENLPQKQLFESMRYSLLAGGKRIRPILALEFCRASGGEWKNAIPFGCALEMIHTYSLIHDDLPCMDDDDYRRGKLTNHKVYGESTAVLAGDALLTAAFEVAANADAKPETIVNVIRVLSQYAGELGMIGGQILDLAGEELALDAEYIEKIQELKTCALLQAGCQIGVLVAEGTPVQLEAAGTYGQSIGRAFQTQDDILDVKGDFQTLGKQIGMDTKKNTLVRLYGVERCREIVNEQTNIAIAALSVFNDSAFLTDLANFLAKRDY